MHGIPWLWVADGSLFPDSVEISPYATRMSPVGQAAEAIRAEAWELVGVRGAGRRLASAPAQ